MPRGCVQGKQRQRILIVDCLRDADESLVTEGRNFLSFFFSLFFPLFFGLFFLLTRMKGGTGFFFFFFTRTHIVGFLALHEQDADSFDSLLRERDTDSSHFSKI